MSIDRKVAALGLAAALTLVGTGCGDDAGDKLAEKITESQTGGDVDLNSEDGSVKFTDDEGNTFETDVNGEGAELPADWPAELAPPDDIKIVTASTSTVNGAKTMTVLASADGTVADWAGGLKTQLEDAGYSIENDTTASGSGGDYAGLSATGDYDVFASITQAADGEAVDITITLSEAQA